MGAVVIDADRVGHEAYLPDSKTWRDVVDAFGEEILKPNGEIDRKKLGGMVFGDQKALQRLNSIMHPRMYHILERRISELRQKDIEGVVLDAAVLIEAGWTPLVDEVWVTTSSVESVVKRLRDRSGLSEDVTMARVRAQISQEERVRYADVIIENDGDLASLRERVESLWRNRVLEKQD